MRRLGAHIAVAAAVSLLAGCASPPVIAPTPSNDPTQDTAALPSAAQRQPVSGRLSIRITQAGQAPQGGSAQFELEGDEASGSLVIRSPIGSTVADARWGSAGVTLTTPRGQQQLASLEALSQQWLRQSVPMAALLQWLRGRPWGGAPHVPRGDGFEQLGWLIGLDGYAEGLIVARRDASDAHPELAGIVLRARLDSGR